MHACMLIDRSEAATSAQQAAREGTHGRRACQADCRCTCRADIACNTCYNVTCIFGPLMTVAGRRLKKSRDFMQLSQALALGIICLTAKPACMMRSKAMEALLRYTEFSVGCRTPPGRCPCTHRATCTRRTPASSCVGICRVAPSCGSSPDQRCAVHRKAHLPFQRACLSGLPLTSQTCCSSCAWFTLSERAFILEGGCLCEWHRL